MILKILSLTLRSKINTVPTIKDITTHETQ